jgi:hypothetical protein
MPGPPPGVADRQYLPLALGSPPTRIAPPTRDARASLLSEAYGFGARAGDGAESWPVTLVRSVDQLRRAANDPMPRWLVLEGGPFYLPEPIPVASRTVIDGRAARLIGSGLLIDRATQVVVHDLTIHAARVDGVSIRAGSHDVWLHRVTITRWGDGALDVTRGATDVTASHLRISDGDRGILVGHEDGWPGDEHIRVTIADAIIERIGRRAPRVRAGYVHMVDTVVREWDGTAADVSNGGRLYLERVEFVPGPSSGPAVEIADGNPRGAVAAIDIQSGSASVELDGTVPPPPYRSVSP